MSSQEIPIGYLVDLTTLEKIRFQFNPDQFSDKKSTNLVKTQIPGASHPRIRWSGGGDRTVRFKLQFVRTSADKPEFVQRQIEALYSLIHPHSSEDPAVHGNPYVQFIFGKLYSLVGLIEDLSVNFNESYDSATLLPEHADVDVSFVVVSDFIVSSADVRSSGAAFNTPTEVVYGRS
jgi:hypothetical protein